MRKLALPLCALTLLGCKPCRTDYGNGDWGRAEQSCGLAFAESHDPREGFMLAHAALQLHHLAVAESAAQAFLVGPRSADALQILGEVALQRDAIDQARIYLGLALALHVAHRDERKVAQVAYD